MNPRRRRHARARRAEQLKQRAENEETIAGLRKACAAIAKRPFYEAAVRHDGTIDDDLYFDLWRTHP